MSASSQVAVVPWAGILYVLISGCCWGFHGVLIKYAYSLGGSFLQVFTVEVLFATVFFWFFRKRFFRDVRPRCAREWGALLAIGMATIGVGSFLFLSYSLGPVAIPATLMFLYLPVVYLVSISRGCLSFCGLKLTSIGFVLLGALLTTQILQTFDEPGAIPAVVTAFCAAMCYAVVFLLTPAVGKFTTVEFRSFAVSGIGFLGCLIIALFMPSLWYDLGEKTTQFYAFAIILGIFGQTLPVLTLMKGLPLTGGSLGGVLASIELPIAVFSAALVLGESLEPLKLAGVGCVLGGILLYNFSDRLRGRIASA